MSTEPKSANTKTTEVIISASTETTEKKKRGRKPTTNNYFAEREERAVRLFLTASTFNEKNEIYDDYLKAPLDKMIESIIRRYKLYRKGMDFREIHHDTHSFLITKVEKFKPSKGIRKFNKELEEFIENSNLNNNELKLGYALMELFDNYNKICIGTDNNKFNKNIILLSLREMTNMSTKEIRTSMRKFKKLYYELTNKLHNL